MHTTRLARGKALVGKGPSSWRVGAPSAEAATGSPQSRTALVKSQVRQRTRRVLQTGSGM
eukprot:27542-Rhodomonas_salina.1